MDYTRRHSAGSSPEGILAGVFVMVEKATAAAGTGLFSAILGWAGYVSAHDAGTLQPGAVKPAILLAIAIIPACTASIACFFLRGLRLDREPGVAAVPIDVGAELSPVGP
jgi:GPH family glycoside/pentoside/hexuronide:cation symporter